MDRFFFRFVTIHAFDRRTDGQTEISSLDHVCIACSAVKINLTTIAYISVCDLQLVCYFSPQTTVTLKMDDLQASEE